MIEHTAVRRETPLTALRTRGYAAARGNVLLETALMMPLLLFFVMFFIWIGIMLNARASLASAVDNALRAAITRGNEDLNDGHQIIPALHASLPNPSADIVMYQQVDSAAGFATYESWHHHWDDPLASRGMNNLPAHYLYALAFINEAMKTSVGQSIRYPCDPRAPGGEGCLKCVFLNPCTIDPSTNMSAVPECTHDSAFSRMAVTCEFSSPSFIIRPINALLRLISGPGTQLSIVGYTAIWDSASDAVNWYQQ